MNLENLTLLTVTFNNNILTGMMLKSFHKQVGELPNVIIIDNGNKIAVDDKLSSCFEILDNFNHKLLKDEKQPSKNHAASIDYALKNCIKTKWCLLVDNDILFHPFLKTFLENFNENEFDCAGEIGYDILPPDRLFPYFCLINVEKFRSEELSYFDKTRTVIKRNGKVFYDTGSSFYNDIKNTWRIHHIKLNKICEHLKGAMLRNKNIKEWLNKYQDLWK